MTTFTMWKEDAEILANRKEREARKTEKTRLNEMSYVERLQYWNDKCKEANSKLDAKLKQERKTSEADRKIKSVVYYREYNYSRDEFESIRESYREYKECQYY